MRRIMNAEPPKPLAATMVPGKVYSIWARARIADLPDAQVQARREHRQLSAGSWRRPAGTKPSGVTRPRCHWYGV